MALKGKRRQRVAINSSEIESLHQQHSHSSRSSFHHQQTEEQPERRTTRSQSALRPGLARRPGLRQAPIPINNANSSSHTRQRNNGYSNNNNNNDNNRNGSGTYSPRRPRRSPRHSTTLQTSPKKQLIVPPSLAKNKKGRKRSYVETETKTESTFSTKKTQNNSLSSPANNNQIYKKKEKTKVIILGAGISGLACAQELIERNYDVLLVEARTRPGGRLKTVPLRLTNNNTNTSNTQDNGASTISSSSSASSTKKKIQEQKQHPLNQRYNFDTTPPPYPETNNNSNNNQQQQNNSTIDQNGSSSHSISSSTQSSNNKNHDSITTTNNNNTNVIQNKRPNVCPVDTGGAFIHGIHKNPIYDLCNRIGIGTSHPMKGDETLLLDYRNAGWPVSAEMDWKVQKRFNHVLEQAFVMSKLVLDGGSDGGETVANGEKNIGNDGAYDVARDHHSTRSRNSTISSNMDVKDNNDSVKQKEHSNGNNHGAKQPQSEPQSKIQEKEKMTTTAIPLPLPKGANSSTSFGSIFRYIASDGKYDIDSLNQSPQSSDQKPSSSSSSSSRQVENLNQQQQQEEQTLPPLTGGYPPNSTEANLFQWHVVNLEMSCGTSLDNLGLSWNEDEQYGFAGAHVFLREGFGCMIESLVDGLNIKYGMEVTGVRIMGPNDNDDDILDDDDDEEKRTSLHFNEKHLKYLGKKIKRDASEVQSSRVTRQSTRRQNGNANENGTTNGTNGKVRRSTRSNKGKVDRMNIGVLDDNQRRMGAYEVSKGLLKEEARMNNLKKEKEEKSTKVQVHTKSGLILEADAVVCTLPLGILSIPASESGHVKFHPPLPERKQTAISRLGFGRYNKCALSFPYVFWNSSDDFIGVIGSPCAGTNILVCNVSVVHDLPVIMMIFGGSYAEYMENLSDETIVNECMDVLKRVWGKKRVKNRVAGQAAKNCGIPDPIDYVVTRWGMDRYARGAFSYVPPGVDGFLELGIMNEPIYDPSKIKDNDHTNGSVRNEDMVRVDEISSSEVKTPIQNRPVLLFAGEATTQYHPSTVHGAFLSGIREAYRLDLALEPALNKHMVFEDSSLYKKTFTLRKRLPPTFLKRKATIDSTPIIPTKDNNKPNYRAGTRKSSRKSGGDTSNKKVKENRDGDTSTTSSTRKSSRHTGKKSYSDSFEPINNNEDAIETKTAEETAVFVQKRSAARRNGNRFTTAEDVAILRGVDSFGRDKDGLKMIQSMMYPLPQLNDGSSSTTSFASQAQQTSQKQRSLNAIYFRYKNLVADGADLDVTANDNKIDTDDTDVLEDLSNAQEWKHWLAPRKSHKWWSIFQEKVAQEEKEDVKREAKQNVTDGTRKSARKQIPKTIVDV